MFQEQLKELVELGKAFVGAVNNVLTEAADESHKQVNIIKQARQKLAQATQTQETVIEMVDNIVDSLNDIDMDIEVNSILLDHLDEAFAELPTYETEGEVVDDE